MSSKNLSLQQFNQAKITRILTNAGLSKSTPSKYKKGKIKGGGEGFAYDYPDEDTMNIRWKPTAGSVISDEERSRNHDKITKALTDAGLNPTKHPNGVHLKKGKK